MRGWYFEIGLDEYDALAMLSEHLWRYFQSAITCLDGFS